MSKSLLDYELFRSDDLSNRWSSQSAIPFPRLDRCLRMSNRVSALSSILRSPTRILGIVLMLVFIAEVAVMFVLPHCHPDFWRIRQSGLGRDLLTLICAAALWWVIIGPLRRIAIQEHQRSETIVANASESILTFDSDGLILSCNRATMDLFGVGAERFDRQIDATGDSRLPRDLNHCPASFELRQPSAADGRRFPVQVSVSEYPSETQTLRIAIIRDLTQSQQAEQERLTMARETEALRAQQMATLAQLATGVAHEIRNPLTSIKMLIQVNRASLPRRGCPPMTWNWSNRKYDEWSGRSTACSIMLDQKQGEFDRVCHSGCPSANRYN